jgi:tRNA(fMet)-specific endonuclease VapC
MGYLLDTNIISDLVRYRQGAAARQIRAHAEADLLTSIIVAAELRFGPA